MTARTVQLVLHYDGTAFAGWQVQPEQRTVQGEVERVLAELCGERVVAQGAGRTDAGVHARGQAGGGGGAGTGAAAMRMPSSNALLPDDVWVAAAHEMRPEFHARFSATSRRYAYLVGTADEARSPFPRRTEWAYRHDYERAALDRAASVLLGEHCFIGFAVRGTAPPTDSHRCTVTCAQWLPPPRGAPGAPRFQRSRGARPGPADGFASLHRHVRPVARSARGPHVRHRGKSIPASHGTLPGRHDARPGQRQASRNGRERTSRSRDERRGVTAGARARAHPREG